MGKAILIVILGSIVLLSILNLSTNKHLNSDTQYSVDFYADARAKNIACSMTQMLLSQIADNLTYETVGTQQASLFGGTAEFTVSRVFFEGDSLTKVYVQADYFGKERTVTAYCKPGGWTPPFIRGAWTANADLDRTISDMDIDGRDYRLDGTIIPGNGVYGVSSSVSFFNTEDAEIGGTHNGVDYPMTFPENPDIIELYDWSGHFPESPDEILGYPEGTLKAIAQSGIGGSQYVKNPIKDGKSFTGFTYPLSGVTYLELDNGVEGEFLLKKKGNKGMLIVHGPNRSSRIIGIKYDATSDGVFTGLIVTDYSFHHHLDILGGVLQLSPNLEMGKNCNGNADHWVHYSSEAIIKATEIVAENSAYAGNNDWGGDNIFAGMGQRRYHVKYWYE